MTVISNARVVRAKYVPKGEAFSNENFKTETVELDTQLNDGEILIRNLYLSLDPYIRYSFDPSGPRALPLGDTVGAFGIGEVFDSKNSAFPVKSVILGLLGLEQYTRISNVQGLIIIPDARNPNIPLLEYTSTLGVGGLSAYAAVKTLVPAFKKDQPVFISSAAGSVGSFIGILAKRAGAFVIGSAGSDEKVNYLLNDLGFDAAFNYKTKDTRAELDAVAPQGIEIYFDHVGGETLDIALEKLKVNGLIVAIGSISTTSVKTPYVTKNLNLIIGKALTIKGFTGFQHLHRFPELWNDIGPLIANGEIPVQKITVVKGLENTGQTFADFMEGKHHGKLVIEAGSL
ncbi:hypothetical protein BGZ98_002864 [Dissophora globulifera]|nr:hypothetical protein BGZ98_002864 [Dissophora globulifera]